MAIDKKPQDKHQSKTCCGKIMQEPNIMYSQLSNVDMISLYSAALSFSTRLIVSSICYLSSESIKTTSSFISQHI